MNLKEFSAVTRQLGRMVNEADVLPENIFPFAIAKMNDMYTLPINDEPTIDDDMLGESATKRITGFLKTLQKEVDEGQDILKMLTHKDAVTEYVESDRESTVEEDSFALQQATWKWIEAGAEPILETDELARLILVAIADWLGDMTVFQRSEAMKFGIPLESVLFIIMASNFTKLNPDGSVIKDANGKVQKGPDFRPPEKALYSLMFEREQLAEEHIEQSKQVELNEALAFPALQIDAVPEEFYADDQDDDDEDDEDLDA